MDGDARLEEDPAGKSTGSSRASGTTLRGEPIPLGGSKVRDFTLPRKAAKQSLSQPYPKPTQVDEVNIQRRLREHSLRN